jgi:TolB protein
MMRFPKSPGLQPRVLLGVAFAALAMAPLVLLRAQEPNDIRLKIEGEATKKTPLAITRVGAPAGGALDDVATEMRQVLVDDLTYSGYFDIVDPSKFAGFTPPAPDAPDLAPWRQIGADSVLSARLLSQGSQLALEARLFDAASSEMVLGKRYAGERSVARRLGHRLANEVITHFTGSPGIALSRIAFVSKHGTAKELYVMDYDGYGIQRITTSGTINLSPAFSPDGMRLAYLSYRRKFPSIFVWNLADGSIVSLPTAGGDLNSAPDWSPDGNRIAYSSTRDGNCEIYVMDNVKSLDGAARRERRLTADRAIDSSPSWSNTGKEIAFTSDRTGSPQVYVMDADGGNVRRLTFDGRRCDSAAWCPTGGRIAYVSRLEGRFVLMMLDLATQQSSTVVSGNFNCEDPRWSSDGRHLTFASDRDGAYQIFTVDADGQNLRRLTRGSASFTPDWSR